MTTYKELKSAIHIEPAIHFAEALLGIRFNRSGENRYRAFCPFHADTKDSFRVYVDGNDEIRFHCFGGCPGKSDWDIYDIIMLSKKCSFQVAQRTWAEYLGVHDFQSYDGKSDRIPEPGQDQLPDETVEFSEPLELPPEIIATLGEGATFYNDLLLSNEDRFGPIFKYLHRRGIDNDIIRQFKIGYAPPFADELYRGRALIKAFLRRFNDDHRTFQPFCKGSLLRLLNDETARGYGYYRQQIDFSDKNPFSRGYGDYFAGRIIFPIYDLNAKPHGIIGRRPDDRGVRWLKQQAKAAITTKSWLYGIDKAARYIKQYRTVILVEGIFDYFAFFNQLQDQQKPVVVSTLGSHFTVEAHSVLKGLGVENFIVAYDWDDAGRNGIMQVANEVGGRVFYLGGLKEGQDPHDKIQIV